MKILMKKRMLCPCCMEEHDVQRITTVESNVFKGVPIVYNAEYYYCDRADEAYADEEQISSNDIAMKNSYREKVGLLTSNQIMAIWPFVLNTVLVKVIYVSYWDGGEKL